LNPIDWTDKVSEAANSTVCSISYSLISVTADPPSTGNATDKILIASALSNTLTIGPFLLDEVGLYTVQMKGYLTKFTDIWASYNFTFKIIKCKVTQINLYQGTVYYTLTHP
jgi:hypothetical protein